MSEPIESLDHGLPSLPNRVHSESNISLVTSDGDVIQVSRSTAEMAELLTFTMANGIFM